MRKQESMDVLIVEDEDNMRRVLNALLQKEGISIIDVESGEEALECLTKYKFYTVLTDLKMPGMDGLELLSRINKEYPDVPVVLLTAHGTVQTAVAAMKEGAFDFLTKPFDRSELLAVVGKALRVGKAAYAEPRDSARFVISDNPEVQEVLRQARKVADSIVTVLITGESGTGKELLARFIHQHSSRSDMPFIAVNCAAIPQPLVESELFGYEKGAFTGAVTSKPGRFELASGGTLFLDEVAAISLEVQAKLLRVLQEQTFERIGGIKTIKTDVRLIAATNADLKKEAGASRFREDLFYRLNVVPLRLPSLRERMSDIPDLAKYFLNRFNVRYHKSVRGFTDATLALMIAYQWPGNIRELENAIERAIVLAESDIIDVADLPEDLRVGPVELDAQMPGPLKATVRAVTEKVERDMIARALEQTGGNVTKAADLLGISRKGLQIKMKELGLRDTE